MSATPPASATSVDKPLVNFWPDYRRNNPYQNLLYQRARADFTIRPGLIEDAIAALQQTQAGVIFHLHWLHALSVGAKTQSEVQARFTLVLNRIDAFKSAGGRFIWTIHNTVSHDSPFPDLEIDLSAQLAARADTIHLHAASSIPEVTRVFDLPLNRISISAHGHYRDIYPDDRLTQQQARHALGIAADDDVILSLGMIRPYKGVDQLIRAARELLPRRPRLRLMVVGIRWTDPLADLTIPLTGHEAARITVRHNYVDPTQMQVYFRAADFAVHPYRRVLTSGSLLLAMGFGLPVVIPSVGMTQEILDGHDAGITYPPDAGQDAITQAVADMLDHKDKGRLIGMGHDARSRATAYVWPDFSVTFQQAIRTKAGQIG